MSSGPARVHVLSYTASSSSPPCRCVGDEPPSLDTSISVPAWSCPGSRWGSTRPRPARCVLAHADTYRSCPCSASRRSPAAALAGTRSRERQLFDAGLLGFAPGLRVQQGMRGVLGSTRPRPALLVSRQRYGSDPTRGASRVRRRRGSWDEFLRPDLTAEASSQEHAERGDASPAYHSSASVPSRGRGDPPVLDTTTGPVTTAISATGSPELHRPPRPRGDHAGSLPGRAARPPSMSTPQGLGGLMPPAPCNDLLGVGAWHRSVRP